MMVVIVSELAVVVLVEVMEVSVVGASGNNNEYSSNDSDSTGDKNVTVMVVAV